MQPDQETLEWAYDVLARHLGDRIEVLPDHPLFPNQKEFNFKTRRVAASTKTQDYTSKVHVMAFTNPFGKPNKVARMPSLICLQIIASPDIYSAVLTSSPEILTCKFDELEVGVNEYLERMLGPKFV